MVRNVQISEELYQRLVTMAHERGSGSVEALLRGLVPSSSVEQQSNSHDVVEQIHQHREQLRATHGELDDSVPLIRADRER